MGKPRKRKQRKMSKTDRLFYKLDREKMWEDQDRRCKYCKEKIARDELTFDHVIPISVTGYHGLDNCVVACEDCNQRKANQIDWTYTEPERTEMEQIVHDMISEWSAKMDERMRRFEFSMTTDTKGGYHKWVRYWEKRGKWK